MSFADRWLALRAANTAAECCEARLDGMGFLWLEPGMTKSELIEILSQRQAHLKSDDVDLAVKALLDMMGSALSGGDRIEIRGFGSFSLHYRPPRLGRNPKTGESVALAGKHVPHFKPGKELRERVSSVAPQEETD